MICIVNAFMEKSHQIYMTLFKYNGQINEPHAQKNNTSAK